VQRRIRIDSGLRIGAFEVDFDVFDGFRRTRLVFPHPNGIQSGIDQDRVAADGVCVIDMAVRRNDGIDFYLTAYSKLARQRWIFRFNLRDGLSITRILMKFLSRGEGLG